MKPRAAFHVLGVLALLIIGDFWIRYLVFCRFNAVSPFNEFVHRWPLAGNGLALLLEFAIGASCLAVIANKLWPIVSLAAMGTLMFFFSQIT